MITPQAVIMVDRFNDRGVKYLVQCSSVSSHQFKESLPMVDALSALVFHRPFEIKFTANSISERMLGCKHVISLVTSYDGVLNTPVLLDSRL